MSQLGDKYWTILSLNLVYL